MDAALKDQNVVAAHRGELLPWRDMRDMCFLGLAAQEREGVLDPYVRREMNALRVYDALAEAKCARSLL